MATEKSDVKLKSATYPLKYKMHVQFLGIKECFTDDVMSFTVIRSPFEKTGSYAIITLTLSIEHYIGVYEHISRNNYPDCQVHCYIVRNQMERGTNAPGRVEDLFQKQYKVISFKAMEDFNYNAPYIKVTAFLINPILFFMQTTNGFNKILEDKTALEALKEYEGWLTSQFGARAFQFEHVGEQVQLNGFKYEQILTRNATDLMIPTMLINHYKMWNKFGYYFFDDFRLDADSNADICAYLVNLGDKNQFKPFDRFKYGDFTIGLRLMNQYPLHDPFNALYQKNPSVNTQNYDMQFGFRKSTGSRSTPQVNVDKQSGQHGSSAGSSIIKSSISVKSGKPTEETLIYAPDDHASALNRFNSIGQQLRDDMLSAETYILHDSSPDYLQFNRRYNLNQFDSKSYTYIPSTICNTFVRDAGRVPMLTHHARFQVFRYRSDDMISRIEENQY